MFDFATSTIFALLNTIDKKKAYTFSLYQLISWFPGDNVLQTKNYTSYFRFA